tara:strand:+ start:722 stop:1993 length:1272 start_codon:yes stop_codon:yes gene_type:complete
MAGFLGNQPPKVPMTSADIVDGTITNDDLAGSITDAKISALSASKLTGSIADARVPASAVTQHVTATNLTPIENDLAVLALQNAVNSNITAHGLQNSWIEQFEDSNSITLSTAFRHDDEYIASGSFAPANWPYTNYADQTFSSVSSHFTDVAYYNGLSLTHTRAGNQAGTTGYMGYAPSPSGFTTGVAFDYLTARTWVSIDTAFFNTHGMIKTWRLEKSDNGSDWTIVDMTGATASATTESITNTNNFAITTDATGLVTNTTNTGNNSTHGGVITFGTAVTARHFRVLMGSYISNGNANSGFKYFIPRYNVSTIAATGSFTSTTITPQDSASKNSLGLVLLYKNNAGTNTLNTDVICKVSADNGSNYSTCVLASKGTFSTGINIAIAPAISVTAGTQLKYQVSFANQASGSKEAQIHGVALQY